MKRDNWHISRDRNRIAAKLKRIQKYVLNAPYNRADVSYNRASYAAAAEIDELRRNALFQPEWKWQGYKSEVEWARAYLGQ